MRCDLCPGNRRRVESSGSEESTIAIYCDDPTWMDEKTGIPMSDKGGKELDNLYLPLAGLKRSDVYVGNIVQCRQERNNVDVKPSDKLAMCCSMNHVPEELLMHNFDTLLLLGPLACSLVGIAKLDFEHGIARYMDIADGPFAGFSGMVWPMYAPAAGIHLTRLMQLMIDDWTNLGKELNARYIHRQPSSGVLATDYRSVDDPREISNYLRQGTCNGLLACDTETDQGSPYSMQISNHRGTGRFIRADRRDLIEYVARSANERHLTWVFHNAVFDLDILEKCGIYVSRFRDTMQELYHLGNQPQGLKAAVYRIFGHRMTSYDEVVIPHSKRVLENWLTEALGYVGSEWSSEIVHPQGKDCPVCGKRHPKQRSEYIKHEAESVLQRVLRETTKPASEYDPWQTPKADKGEIKPRLVGREWMSAIEKQIGKLPVPSIVHAPMAEQIAYGCSDADHTLRLALWLDEERNRLMKEEWNIECDSAA